MEIACQNTFQIFRLDRRNNGRGQKSHVRRVGPQFIKLALGQVERSVLLDGSDSVPEKVDSQDRVFVAPSADGSAAFGGDEVAARCSDCQIVVCVVDTPEADEGKEGLVEGEWPE